jgi:transposase-like protein
MGRKANYSKEVKLKAIHDYIDGKKSAIQLSNEIGFEVSKLYLWVKKYQNWGESIFDDKPRNNCYSREFKLQVVKEYLSGQGSLNDIVVKL